MNNSLILCLGTTPAVQRTMTFDRLTIDAVNRAVEVRQSASGKPVNVVRVLHTIGADALVTGFVGGAGGRFMCSDLDAAGIGHDFVEVEPETRVCVTVVDRSARTATELIEEPKAVGESGWQALRAKLESLLPRASVLVLSGSIAPGTSSDFYADCVRAANRFNVKTIIDATGEPLRRALLEKPFIVKPNRSELASTLKATIDSEESLRQAIARVINGGASWAIVTMGPDGAIVSNGREFWRVIVPRIEVVSPIGSGDSLAAGVAAGIARGMSVPDACALGAACGAANAMTAVAGYVEYEQVERLRARIRVEPM
jgi:tagatose 6-phosphate kinase